MVSVLPGQAPDVIQLLVLFGCHLLTHDPLLFLQDGVQVVELLTHQSLLPPTIFLHVA